MKLYCPPFPADGTTQSGFGDTGDQMLAYLAKRVTSCWVGVSGLSQFSPEWSSQVV